MQAVMMVAGKSTRTYPLTLTRPKPLLPVLNRPLIFYNLDQLADWVDDVILIVGYKKEMIYELVGESYKGMRIQYQEQKEQLGTGHAVLQAKHHITGPFLVMNGDDLFAKEDMQRLLNHRYAALALRVPDPSQYGVFQVNEKNAVIRLVEKPKEFLGNLANIGCYFFQPELFDVLEHTEPSERGEIEITSAIQEVAEREPVIAVETTGYWLPTGFPWDLLRTQNYLFDHQFSSNILGQVSPQATIEGPVHIEKNAVIEAGATICGPVAIGESAKIQSGSYVGPYSSIGGGSIVETGVRIERSLIMAGCVIGAGAQIRHSVVGENVEVGEAVVCFSRHLRQNEIWSSVKGKWLNTGLTQLGAVIADQAAIGAGTRIFPGCKIWPNLDVPMASSVERDLKEN